MLCAGFVVAGFLPKQLAADHKALLELKLRHTAIGHRMRALEDIAHFAERWAGEPGGQACDGFESGENGRGSAGLVPGC